MAQTHDDRSALTDTLTFRIDASAGWKFPVSKVTVTVDVTEGDGRVADLDELFGQVCERLHSFIEARWEIDAFRRMPDAAGLARGRFVASAHVSPYETHELERRARDASSDGFNISAPVNVRWWLMDAASTRLESLEAGLLEQIVDRARRLSRVTRRRWRIGDVSLHYHRWSAEQLLSPGRAPHAPADAPLRCPTVKVEFLKITAEVVLKSNAPGFRPLRLPAPPPPPPPPDPVVSLGSFSFTRARPADNQPKS